MADDALKITGLCKSYGDFSLKDINLKVPEGTVVGLVGENGAGKTTTIKASLDLIKKIVARFHSLARKCRMTL